VSRGLFLTFEGPEGAGKSTQVRLLVDHLEAQGRDVTVTREPGGTPTAEAIREVLIGGRAQSMSDTCELLLMLAGRADHVAGRIRPALEAGGVVICDRFVDSTVAYQGGARGIDRERIDELNRFVCQDAWPDLTILLDLPPEVGLRRASIYGADRIEQEGLEFHRRVRQAYLDLAEADPERFVVVDADREKDAVQADVRASVDAALRRPVQGAA
jgi:dTMP kinase